MRATRSLLGKQVVEHWPLTSVEVDHQPCIALQQRMAAVDAAVQLQTGFPDTHLVVDVQLFAKRAQQLMSSLQVVAVVLGLPQTR